MHGSDSPYPSAGDCSQRPPPLPPPRRPRGTLVLWIVACTVGVVTTLGLAVGLGMVGLRGKDAFLRPDRRSAELFDFQKLLAQTAFERGDYVGALDSYRRADFTRGGDFEVAEGFRRTRLIAAKVTQEAINLEQSDFAEAVEKYYLGAQLSNVYAQCKLGQAYTRGQGGLPKDVALAALWQGKAFAQDDAVAQELLGAKSARGLLFPRYNPDYRYRRSPTPASSWLAWQNP